MPLVSELSDQCSTRRYVEGIKESLEKHRWNAEKVVKSLTKAWQRVPRNLIIASIQRTSLQINDCLLKIHCDAWQDFKIGRSLKKFVTFDDKLSTANASYKQCKPTDEAHERRLETTQIITLINNHFDRIDWKRNERINGYAHCLSVNLRGIYLTRHSIDRQSKSSLKRSYDKAELNEDPKDKEAANNAQQPNDDSTSRNNIADIVGVPSPAKLPKIGDVRSTMHENATRTCKMYNALAAAPAETRIADYKWQLNEIINNNERRREAKKSRCHAGNERSFESRVDITSHSDIALRHEAQKVPRDGIVISMDWNENGVRRSRKSLKRRRSRSDHNDAESRNNPDDNEPERKRLHFDSNWTERYETMFVFGSSDFIRTLSNISANILNASVAQRPRLRRACETERSIFTIRPRRD